MSNTIPLHKKILLVSAERSAAMLTKACKEPGYVFGLPAFIAEVPESNRPFQIMVPVLVCKGVSVEAYKLHFTPGVLALEVTTHGLFKGAWEKYRFFYDQEMSMRIAGGLDTTDLNRDFDEQRPKRHAEDSRRVEGVIGAVLSTLLTPVKHEEPKS